MEFNLIYVLPTPPGGILGIKRLDLCFFGLFHKISIILSLRVATTPNKHSISVGITHGTDNMGGANLCHLLCRLKWSIKERSKNIKKKKRVFFCCCCCCYLLLCITSGIPKTRLSILWPTKAKDLAKGVIKDTSRWEVSFLALLRRALPDSLAVAGPMKVYM